MAGYLPIGDANAITLEIELEILRRYSSQESEEYVVTKRKYDEISRQLAKFQSRDARGEEPTSVHSFFPAFDEAPDVLLQILQVLFRVRASSSKGRWNVTLQTCAKRKRT